MDEEKCWRGPKTEPFSIFRGPKLLNHFFFESCFEGHERFPNANPPLQGFSRKIFLQRAIWCQRKIFQQIYLKALGLSRGKGFSFKNGNQSACSSDSHELRSNEIPDGSIRAGRNISKRTSCFGSCKAEKIVGYLP